MGKWFVTHPDCPNVISSPVKIQPTVGLTIPEFLRQNLEGWKDSVAFECGVTGRKYNFGDIFKKSQSFAASLIQQGFERKDVGCILLPNLPEFPIVALGFWDAGLIVSPLNPSHTPAELEKQIECCKGKVIVTLPELLPLIQGMKPRCPSLQKIITIGDHSEGDSLSFAEMIKTDPIGVNLLKGTEINTLSETAIITYSSGTTGLPKGVQLTHSGFTTNLVQITQPGYLEPRFFSTSGNNQERFLGVIPFFHMFGMQIIMGLSLYLGAHTLCLPKFSSSTFAKALKRHKPTGLHLVAPLISVINTCNDIDSADLDETRFVLAGGAPISPHLIKTLLDKVDHYMIFQECYGMTEICTLSHIVPPESRNTKLRSGGVLTPGTSCKIVDVVTGKSLGPNETGEIRVIGPQVMKGYFNNEKATLEAFDSDGYLRTGDIGYFDEDGFFYIVDRLKELIKVKGFQVAPAELESVLRLHPEIADVGVIGVQHDKFGEAPRAYVVRKSASLTESSVSGFLNGKLADYKQLVGGVEFIDAIPKNATGKILRRVLAEDFRSKFITN